MTITAAIVDYGLGNLFSVKHACNHVGMTAEITPDKAKILAADLIILPGVGAYRDAMENLHRLDLVKPLQDIAQSDKMLLGVCLGQQLLMTESYEFGTHKGLGIIDGTVEPFLNPTDSWGTGDNRVERRLKVPQIGWNGVCPMKSWTGTPLEGIREGEEMYFVHSYYVKPQNPAVTLANSVYGGIEFASALRLSDTVFSFQFHPERSGTEGLKIYRKIAAMIREK